MLSKDDLMATYVIKAQFEIDGDSDAYFRRLESGRGNTFDPGGLQKPYRVALLRRDYAAADKALSEANLAGIQGPENVLNEPVALHRALVAFLWGRPDEARAFAQQAISSLRGSQFTPRQQPFVLMAIADAEAYSGRAADADRDASAALAEATTHDALDAMVLQGELGRVHAALGEREEALGVLRTMIAGPCFMTPGEIRIDPLWSRIKDDPRFEEILKSAKPL
jgi:tetratricopeptide (TPR) repeat protein